MKRCNQIYLITLISCSELLTDHWWTFACFWGYLDNIVLSAALCWLLADVLAHLLIASFEWLSHRTMTWVHRKEKQESLFYFLSLHLLWFFKDLANCKFKSIFRKDCRCWHRIPLEPIQSYHILISSFFLLLSFPPCCFNQWEAGVADLCPSASFSPLQSAGVENPCHLTPPALVLIREKCSGSSGSWIPGPSLPLTTVRPNSTLIALTPRHFPVQSLCTLGC